MRVLVGDLMDLTRIRLGEGGGIPIAPVEADLGRLARRIADELSLAHPDRDIRCEVHGDVAARCDTGRIGQALGNLLSNALEHGPPDEPITVTARGGPGGAMLVVHNSGPPIPPERLEEIFQPMRRFAQQSPAASTAVSGLGLGLYIARMIAIAHGGDITVESAPDAGTTFTIHLPRHLAEHRSLPRARSAPSPREGQM